MDLENGGELSKSKPDVAKILKSLQFPFIKSGKFIFRNIASLGAKHCFIPDEALLCHKQTVLFYLKVSLNICKAVIYAI